MTLRLAFRRSAFSSASSLDSAMPGRPLRNSRGPIIRRGTEPTNRCNVRCCARRAAALPSMGHMRQQEAEQEAARRNAEDERRDRFLFYALDHSAGLGDDAWEVEMRLRTADDGPMPAAVPVAAAAPAEAVEASEPLETPE